LNEFASQQVSQQFELLESGRFTSLLPEGEVDLFLEVFSSPPKLVINGAVHIAIPLVELARTMGYYTIVIDARRTFATRERFPHADELVIEWPSDALKKIQLDESTYFVTLTHDDKLDVPALEVVLDSPVRYVGALGSTKTNANRARQLLENGVSEEKISRIHAPIGLDLGAKGVEEIALSIMAEMVAVRHGKGSKKERQIA
jgi:xanthine dehydrogenase accessory factor